MLDQYIKLGRILNSNENTSNSEFNRKSNAKFEFEVEFEVLYIKFDQNRQTNSTQNGRIWSNLSKNGIFQAENII